MPPFRQGCGRLRERLIPRLQAGKFQRQFSPSNRSDWDSFRIRRSGYARFSVLVGVGSSGLILERSPGRRSFKRQTLDQRDAGPSADFGRNAIGRADEWQSRPRTLPRSPDTSGLPDLEATVDSLHVGSQDKAGSFWGQAEFKKTGCHYRSPGSSPTDSGFEPSDASIASTGSS